MPLSLTGLQPIDPSDEPWGRKLLIKGRKLLIKKMEWQFVDSG
jgi:hypothetical protein